MTENEAIFSILGKIKPYLNDDIDISPREILFELNNQRNLFLRNEYNKNRSIDADTIQDLGCVEIEAIDPSECCNISTSCKVMRTVLEIPTLIELYNDIALTRVGPINKALKEYSRTTLEGAKWVGNGKYTKNEIYVYYDNHRIYLISNNDKHKFIDYINVKGILENPSDAISFTNCSTNNACYSSDSKYPVKAWMFNYIQGEVIKKFLNLYNIPTDITNDGVDNSTIIKAVK